MGLASLLGGGEVYSSTEVWVDRLRAGTDPKNDEFWGLSDNTDQRMVGMCCLGYSRGRAAILG